MPDWALSAVPDRNNRYLPSSPCGLAVPFVPYVAESWTVEDVAEILRGSTGGVPLAGWVELAQALLDELPHGSGGGAR